MFHACRRQAKERNRNKKKKIRELRKVRCCYLCCFYCYSALHHNNFTAELGLRGVDDYYLGWEFNLQLNNDYDCRMPRDAAFYCFIPSYSNSFQACSNRSTHWKEKSCWCLQEEACTNAKMLKITRWLCCGDARRHPQEMRIGLMEYEIWFWKSSVAVHETQRIRILNCFVIFCRLERTNHI